MIRCTPEEVMKAYRMLEEIGAIRRLESEAHRVKDSDFGEFREVVLQSAAAMHGHAARARIIKLGEAFEQRMKQVRELAVSGDCFQQIFGMPPPPTLGTAFGPYTVEFELGRKDYEGLLPRLKLGREYFDTIGFCLPSAMLPCMSQEVGGSVILLRRKEAAPQRLQAPSSDGRVGAAVPSPAVISYSTRKHEERHGAQYLLDKAGYPLHDKVGSDFLREQFAADGEGDEHQDGLLTHTNFYARLGVERGNIRGLACALHHGNATAAQKLMDQRERVIDALAAAYETAGADRTARDAIGWALNLMPFPVADRKLHALAVAYQQR